MTRPSQSQRYCATLVAARAGNFHIALRLLPGDKRNALYALYAFARMADDIVDDGGPDPAGRLENLRLQLDDVWHKPPEDGPDWRAALGQTLRRHSLPRGLFDDFLAGMQADLDPQPHLTWTDTEQYCYQAASTVGLLCLEVFGYTSPRARRLARDLGIAMQLTNILRDLKEDHTRGRQYLPLEDYRDFSLDPEDLMQSRPPAAADAFLRFQIDRARSFFDSSRDLDTLLDADAKFCPRALRAIYGEYINLMSKDPLAALKAPLKISKGKKFWIAINSRWSR